MSKVSPLTPTKLLSRELNARFYYHGTSGFYLNRQLEKHGRYKHDRTPLCVAADNFDLAATYACDRTMCFAHTPIVLKINGDKVRKRIYPDPTEYVPVIDFLRREEFEIIAVDRELYFAWCKKHKR